LNCFACRISALFTPGETASDNAMISVYPFGDELYALTEYPVIHRFDPNTLDTLDRVSEDTDSQSCKTSADSRRHTICLIHIIFHILNVIYVLNRHHIKLRNVLNKLYHVNYMPKCREKLIIFFV
jgi:hypothetical protein